LIQTNIGTVDKEQKTVERVVVVVEGEKEELLKRGVEKGRIIGESINFTRDPRKRTWRLHDSHRYGRAREGHRK
jgi:hypothetical protein